MGKQKYYKDSKGEDWIDEFARTKTPEEFRGAMSFVIGKYNRRLGKKNGIMSEVRKIADYSARWLEYEEALHDSPESMLLMRGLRERPQKEIDTQAALQNQSTT